ncbi:MAG: MATE family efflux transporter [Faecalimonas sp.]|nr:MATE family efflux transporter [Faecalimonas sp.]
MSSKQMTTGSVSKLFFHYLLPSIFATMVTSIYVLADTIVIGQGIGPDAMAALNIVLPIFSLFFGIGLLFGVGGSVLMSIARGRGDKQLGDRYFTIALLLTAIISLLSTIFLSLFIDPLADFLGATEVTMPYILDYAPYVIWGLSAFAFSSFLQAFVRNDGAPRLSMAAVITGGVLNIILDIVFVFPLDLGMAGASIASVIGSLCTVCILLTHFFSKSCGLRLCFKGLSLSHAGKVFANGFTSFLVEITSGITIFVFNLQLLKYAGNDGVTIYGVISNTVIIVSCLANGINQAAQPIISTNHGAGLVERIAKVRRLGTRTAFLICAVPTLLGLIVPNMFTYIFIKPTAEVLALSPLAIRTYFLAFLAMGVNMFIVGYFQATTKPLFSLILCLLRGCVLGVLFVLILAPSLGLFGIWLATPLAESVTLLIAWYFLHRSKKEVQV